jgi:hypothetical protein
LSRSVCSFPEIKNGEGIGLRGISGLPFTTMSTLSSWVLFLCVTLVSCGGSDPAKELALAPWSVLSVRAPNPFEEVASTTIQGAVAVDELLYMRRRSLIFVTDYASGRVHMLDDRMRHSEERFCILEDVFPDEEHRPDQQEGCPDGAVAIHRGFLQAESAIVAMDADQERLEVHFLTETGTLYKLNTDLQEMSAFDYLRLPEHGVSLGRSFSDETIVRVAGNWVWVASGLELTAFDRLNGEERAHYDLPAVALDMEFFQGFALVATEQGLWETGGNFQVSNVATDLFRDSTSAVWAVYPEAEQVVRLDDGFVFTVPGLTGPVASKSGESAMWAMAGDDLVIVGEEGVVLSYPVEDVVDIRSHGKSELTVLHADGRVSAFFDETELIGGSPLSFVMASFIERPKSPVSDEPCVGGDSNVEGHVRLASNNLGFLKDLPVPVALGITSHMGRRARQCGVAEQLSASISADFVEVGILFHQTVEEECATDLACYTNFLTANTLVVASYGKPVSWASGLARHYEDGADWVQGLIGSGLIDRFLSFGFSVLADVPHSTDVRSKEAYPLEVHDRSRPWTVSSSKYSEFHDEEGQLALFPGDSRAAFNLGSCANLLVRECGILSEGGGEVLDEEDIEVLDLLVHRAMAERDREEVSTWSFHLPDIGVWDYSEGCVSENRVWTGDCGAARLQDWFFDLHTQFALNGVLQWSRPSELAWP